MADVNKLLPFKAVHSYIAIHVDDPYDNCHPIEDKIQNEKKDSIFMSKRNIIIIQFCLGGFQKLIPSPRPLIPTLVRLIHASVRQGLENSETTERSLCNLNHCFNVS